jgi:hypothetical protein
MHSAECICSQPNASDLRMYLSSGFDTSSRLTEVYLHYDKLGMYQNRQAHTLQIRDSAFKFGTSAVSESSAALGPIWQCADDLSTNTIECCRKCSTRIFFATIKRARTHEQTARSLPPTTTAPPICASIALKTRHDDFKTLTGRPRPD